MGQQELETLNENFDRVGAERDALREAMTQSVHERGEATRECDALRASLAEARKAEAEAKHAIATFSKAADEVDPLRAKLAQAEKQLEEAGALRNELQSKKREFESMR